ncbi:N-terminal double-transmembrane domain-containing protein [Mariniphaga anaerophila]|uniref:N-terminal double-transmembrane domain-containing protein n=1 Tax=Mariniphaga anaerophila TaxID=1484053 RepID=A0A1M5EVF3_9BACT|nr:BatA domain-containing protein [Mariniphaga anaerophila]SHF83159.1 N-terminal double-transmembrane domain-containing protein [Mariniphaga anaerophila]
MKFLYPTFLFALFTIVIPIIIHLFSFRRYKTVYFSHVGFLKDIKKESQKKSRLKQLLMLLARILTIVFLVFAFSQPYIPADKETATSSSGEVIGVYIDNSFSMNALSEKGQLLERARNKAAEIGQSYPAGTMFRLLTNDLTPKHQHLLNKEQFISQVANIKSSPASVSLSLIHNRFEMQNKLHENTGRGTLYLISDFQQNITDPENFSEETGFSYFMPLIPNQVNNLYIDSCWVEVPAHGLNQEENIFVKIKNSSDEDYQNLPLRLFLNDSLKSITNFSVSARNEITASLKYTNVSSGIQLGRVEITDYPFTHDNTWYLSYFVEPILKALAIYSNTESSQEGLGYISALFENDDYVELETMSIQSLQISKLAESNAIFLINPENFSSGFLSKLESIVDAGTSVVLFPQLSQQAPAYNQFLSKFNANTVSGVDTTSLEISGIDFDNRFFRNVFKEQKENALLPKIDGHLKFSENIRSNETPLLWFQNGDKALSGLPYGKGKVWVFAFPLDKRNEMFARDILFVPSLYNIVLNSLPDQQISHTIGKEQTFILPRNVNASLESSIKIENRKTGETFIPGTGISGQGMRIDPGNSIETAGHYLVKSNNETLTALSFNYNRNESDLRYFSPAELEKRIQLANLKNASVLTNLSANFTEVLQEIQKGKQLWKWCILFALLFIVTEVLIARFWKQ